jgi:uncharacterized membrane protein SirB2
VLEFAEWLQTTPVSVTIQSVNWIIPLLQSLHILMIGVVFISILMIALRVLGRVRADEAFAVVWSRFAPWMWCGLVVMAVTGVTLIVGEPIREFTALSFWLKMALLVVAITSTVVFAKTVKPSVSADAPVDREFSAATKSAVVATLVIWLTIIFLGRAIAYDVAVWGTLSPAA